MSNFSTFRLQCLKQGQMPMATGRLVQQWPGKTQEAICH